MTVPLMQNLPKPPNRKSQAYGKPPGRKRMYAEPTTTITFRVPESHVVTIREIIHSYLDKVSINPEKNGKKND